MRAGLALVLVLGPSIADAQTDAEEDWRFHSKSAVDAVHAQANAIYPTLLTEARLSYRDLDDGGSIAAFTFEASIPIPFVIVPGVSFGNIYSLLRIELPLASVKPPMMERTTGVGDIHLIDAAIKYWGDRLAVGAGIASLIPSASDEVLGTGKLALGPIAGATVSLGAEEQVSLSIIAENLTSVAGASMRPDLNTLFLRPAAIYFFNATYVGIEPEFRIDWEDDGAVALLLTARAGHAVNKRWVFVLEPTWTAFGDGQNNLGLSVIASYVPW
jgi:hypothetical protein